MTYRTPAETMREWNEVAAVMVLLWLSTGLEVQVTTGGQAGRLVSLAMPWVEDPLPAVSHDGTAAVFW